MKSVDQSITQLHSSPYWNERREAALALGHMPPSEVREALLRALDDSDDDVVQAALVALGTVGDESAVEKMILPRYLNHSDPRVRWATLKAIERIGNSFVVAEVAGLVDDEVWVVRNEAQKVLRKQVESIVAHSSPESAQRMVGLLTTTNEELRSILIDAFVQIGPRIKPLLGSFLKVGGTRIQTAIAQVVGRLRYSEYLPLLIDLLDSTETSIRKSAVTALGQIADEAAVPAIIRRFADSSLVIQRIAVEAAIRIGGPAVSPLQEALRFSSRKTIHKNVLTALAGIRDASSIPYFIDYLGSTYFIVRRAAIEGLVEHGRDAIGPVQDVIRTVELPMVDDLLKQAKSGGTTAIRVRAIQALGVLADHRAVHLLKHLAASDDPAVQENALASLSEIGCACWRRCGALAVLRSLGVAPDLDLIVEKLDDDSENVRHRAVRVLARCKNSRAVPPLLQTAAIDGNATIRCEALRAADELAPADARVVESAQKAHSDVSPRVKAEAIRIIGRSPDVNNLIPLMDSLKSSSWEVRRNAALALGNMGNVALPSLLERLKAGGEAEIESIMRAIGNVGTAAAIPAIEEAASKTPDDSPVRHAAKKAVGDIRKKEAQEEADRK